MPRVDGGTVRWTPVLVFTVLACALAWLVCLPPLDRSGRLGVGTRVVGSAGDDVHTLRSSGDRGAAAATCSRASGAPAARDRTDATCRKAGALLARRDRPALARRPRRHRRRRTPASRSPRPRHVQRVRRDASRGSAGRLADRSARARAGRGDPDRCGAERGARIRGGSRVARAPAAGAPAARGLAVRTDHRCGLGRLAQPDHPVGLRLRSSGLVRGLPDDRRIHGRRDVPRLAPDLERLPVARRPRGTVRSTHRAAWCCCSHRRSTRPTSPSRARSASGPGSSQQCSRRSSWRAHVESGIVLEYEGDARTDATCRSDGSRASRQDREPSIRPAQRAGATSVPPGRQRRRARPARCPRQRTAR